MSINQTFNPPASAAASSLYFAAQTLGADTDTITFSGLDGNTHKLYRGRIYGPGTNGGTISALINGASTGIEHGTAALAQGNIAWAGFTTLGSCRATNDITFEIGAALIGSCYRSFKGHMSMPLAAGTWFQYIFYGQWLNTTDNLTSFSFVSTAPGQFKAGTIAVIEQVRTA